MALASVVTLMLLSVNITENYAEIEVQPGTALDIAELASAQSEIMCSDDVAIEDLKAAQKAGKALLALYKSGVEYFKVGNGDEGNFDKFKVRWSVRKNPEEGESLYNAPVLTGMGGFHPANVAGFASQLEKIGSRVAKIRRMNENKKPDDPTVVPAGEWCWDDPQVVLNAMAAMHGKITKLDDSADIENLLGEVYKVDPDAGKIRFLTTPPEPVVAA